MKKATKPAVTVAALKPGQKPYPIPSPNGEAILIGRNWWRFVEWEEISGIAVDEDGPLYDAVVDFERHEIWIAHYDLDTYRAAYDAAVTLIERRLTATKRSVGSKS